MTTEEQIKTLVEYLKLKVEQKDWHGVSDAANDLRVLEERLLRPRNPFAVGAPIVPKHSAKLHPISEY